ncbi:MAG: hypothetical protein ACTHJ8_10400 [Mucilaginibacter sp.]
MKKIIFIFICLSACCSLSGCGLMEMSFRAGFIMALIIAAIIGLLIWIFHFSFKLLGKYFPAVRYYRDALLKD